MVSQSALVSVGALSFLFVVGWFYVHESSEFDAQQASLKNYDDTATRLDILATQQSTLLQHLNNLHNAVNKNSELSLRSAGTEVLSQAGKALKMVDQPVAVAPKEDASVTAPILPTRKLFIIINSYVGGEGRRSAARGTWVKELQAMYKPDNIEAKFFVGKSENPEAMKKVYAEQATYNDIVVIDFPDGYSSLGEKVPRLYKKVCEMYNASYVSKVDDDTWVNVKLLPSLLARMKPERTYLGLMMEGMEVLRGAHKNAENDLPRSMRTFPPYASGVMTIITHDLAMLLGNPPIKQIKMVNDDAFFGILFFPFDVERIQETRIHPWGIKECKPPAQVAAAHYVPPHCFARLSANISQDKPVCNSHHGCM